MEKKVYFEWIAYKMNLIKLKKLVLENVISPMKHIILFWHLKKITVWILLQEIWIQFILIGA